MICKYNKTSINLLSILAMFLTIPLLQAQQDLEVEDGKLIVKRTNLASQVEVSTTGANADAYIQFGDDGNANDVTMGWDGGDEIFKLSLSTGLENSGFTFKENSNSARFGLGTLPDDNARVKINYNSSAGTTPEAQLLIQENNNTDFSRLQFGQNGIDAYWHVAAKASTVDDPKINFYYHNGTTGDNIVTIDGDDDRLGINDASPDYTLDIHHDSGTPASAPGNGISIANTGGNNNQWQVYVNNSSGDLSLYKNAAFRGDFDATTGNYTAASDRRLKANIRPLRNQLAIIQMLKPSQYQFKDRDQNRECFGLIAQDVQEVLPEIVSSVGNEEGEDQTLGISYSELIPVLIAGMQEQQEIIENLKNRLGALENKKTKKKKKRANKK